MLLEMRIALCFLILAAPAVLPAADDPYAAEVFAKNCASCHQSEAGANRRIPRIGRAEDRVLGGHSEDARQRHHERRKRHSYRPMSAPQAGDARRNHRHAGRSAREEIANPCPAGVGWKGGSAFGSWGGDLANSRFQAPAAAGLRAEDVPRLKLAWAFAFPDTSTLRSQPAVYRGTVFAGAQDGSVYALDAATGCVHWAASVESQVRSGMVVGEVGGNPVVFFGDAAGYLYALDGTSGKQLWKMRPEEHPAATQTSTPVFYRGRLYVGSASREESLSISPGYVCCTFRGSESAIDAATGKIVWKRYMIPEAAKERAKSHRGARVAGPSGAGIWTAATLDPDHDAVYVVTGDNYSDPPTALSDAVSRAENVDHGDILWSKQFTAKRCV